MSVLNKNPFACSAEHIPYTVLHTPSIYKTKKGDFCATFKIQGAPFSSLTENERDNLQHLLHNAFLNIYHPRVSLWTHIIRRKESFFPKGKFQSEFTEKLHEKYRKNIINNHLMINDLYVTIVLRPAMQQKGIFSALTKISVTEMIQDSIELLEKFIGQLAIALDTQFKAHLLTTYEHNNFIYSESLEFLHYLANGFHAKMPVPKMQISQYLPTSDLLFGSEAGESRGVNSTRFFASLKIKEYPNYPDNGLVNKLLEQPFEFVLTQSFAFIEKISAQATIKLQADRLTTSGDLGESQIDDLKLLQDKLQRGDITAGEHHFSLIIFANTEKQLNNNLYTAQSQLGEMAMVSTRENITLEAAWWSQLPGNFGYRTQPSLITSENFVCFNSLHNFSFGRPQGNPWGEPVCLFQTESGSPYFYNFHKSDKTETFDDLKRKNARNTNSADEKILKVHDYPLANTIIIGSSGTGKTVLQNFLISMLERYNPSPRAFFFDKDNGAEIYVKAVGGKYSTLKLGEPTGFNPFQLDDSPATRKYLLDLIQILVGKPFDHRHTQNAEIALNSVFASPKEHRSIHFFYDHLDSGMTDSIKPRLQKWVTGSNAWVFNNEVDSLDFAHYRFFGFDTTEFINDKELCSPIFSYLFHRMQELLDGTPFVCFMDEFWRLIQEDIIATEVKDKQKTIRKENGFLVMATQSPSDVLKNTHARTLLEQSATTIFLPNNNADHADYVEGFKLTEGEYDAILKMPAKSRKFLIKQEGNASIVKLNLGGMEDELSVLSGTRDTVTLCREIISQYGENPQDWLPHFYNRR